MKSTRGYNLVILLSDTIKKSRVLHWTGIKAISKAYKTREPPPYYVSNSKRTFNKVSFDGRDTYFLETFIVTETSSWLCLS